jgi:hypothetical protein
MTENPNPNPKCRIQWDDNVIKNIHKNIYNEQKYLVWNVGLVYKQTINSESSCSSCSSRSTIDIISTGMGSDSRRRK